jgi:hypothetical protein
VSPPPQKTKALYIPPGQQRQQRPRALALDTYRLTLSREGNGQIMHEWGGIPADKVRPLLEAMRRYLPFLAKAAAAKQAWDKLMDLLS